MTRSAAQDAAQRLELRVPLHLDNRNTGRGHTWHKPAKARKEIEAILRVLPHHPVMTPCRIHLTRVLGPRQGLFDADSLLRGTAKELIDAIVAVGIIPDDGPKHVHAVTADQDTSQRETGPATIVIIETIKGAA